MRVPVPELFLAFVLAAGFAAVGEIVLRRRVQRVGEVNEAMLVGMGVCAASLFPLTFLFSRHALLAEAFGVGAALVRSIVLRLRRAPAVPPRPRFETDPWARTILAVVAVVAIGFVALNFRYTYLWDGFLIWTTKAQLLFHSGRLTREWFPNDLYDLRHLAYPPLLPLCEALLSLLRGGFDFDRLKPVFLPFYFSLLIGTFDAARSVVPARLAAVATLLVCLVPALSTQYAAGAFADMPQAAFVAGVVAAGLAGRRDALPWLIGALTTVKAEGTILAGIACAAVLFAQLLESRALPPRAEVPTRGIAIVAAFLLVRFTYVRWIAAPELVYTLGSAAALARIPQTLKLCLRELALPSRWGFLWPAFLAASAILFARGSSREKALAAGTAAALLVAMVPFLFSNWPLALQVEQAYFRLAGQIVPAAAVVVVCGYAAAVGRRDPSPVLR